MTLTPGALLGRYEILAALGAGGMGEVYRARDTRLDRTVAVKVLPGHLASNPDLRQRLEREARAISALNHPHICALYDAGHQDGVDFLVMEYLEGETLAGRILRGPLPIGQVLRLGAEIAEALDNAHRAGIVHRDLKPANVMLTKGGAKLLDFGIAKLRAVLGGPLSESEREAMDEATTQEEPLTGVGTVLGTFHYMAPQQLEGKKADARSDLFALGAVIYGMATGRRAFQGTSRASVIAEVLTKDPPPISSLQPMAPPALDRLVHGCLAKDPDERWQSAHDVMAELRWIGEGGSQAGPAAPLVTRRRVRERTAWTLAAALAAIAILATWSARRTVPSERQPVIHSAFSPVGKPFRGGAAPEISPDGRYVAFFSLDVLDRKAPLLVRPLGADEARALPGTEGAFLPFWSPDSRSVAFFADRQLKRTDLVGGSVTTIGEIGDLFGRGGTWNRDGVIVFSGSRAGRLFRVSAGGGVPQPVTRLAPSRGDTAHSWPHFLPDGRHFLYVASPYYGQGRRDALFLATLDGKENRALLSDLGSAAAGQLRFIFASGRLLFMRHGTLLAQPFDPERDGLRGEPVAVAERVLGFFSAASNGVLVFLAQPSESEGEIGWRTREGTRLNASAEPLEYQDVRISPDGATIAAQIFDLNLGQRELWQLDAALGARRRLTFGSEDTWSPVWSPDGSRIAYGADRNAVTGIYERSSAGAGGERLLFPFPGEVTPTDWSLDGKFMAMTLKNAEAPKSTGDFWILPFVGGAKPYPFLESPADKTGARFSPDGRYLAYTSDESGRSEVYVQSFPGAGGKWQISNGGYYPIWRRDGRELFFVSEDYHLMSAEVRTAGNFQARPPKLVFPEAVFSSSLFSYDVTRDGQRILIAGPGRKTAAPLIHVIVNWPAELERE